MTPAEAKAEGYGKPEDVKPPEYPLGTRLSLTDEVAKALFPKLPEVGKSVALTGAAEVVSINITQQQGGADRICIELQVTDLDATEVETKKSASETIYGD